MKWFLVAAVAGLASFGGSYAAHMVRDRELQPSAAKVDSAQGACAELNGKLTRFENVFLKDPEQEFLDRFKKNP